MKKIFIVTVNYNTAEDTNNFLTTLAKIKSAGFTVYTIVVDNGSKEPFTLEKKWQKNDSIKVIRSEENTGFSGGYNIGMRYALEHDADYIMIVNNDTLMHPNLIEEFFVACEKNSQIGIACPKIYFAKGSEFHKDRYTKKDLGKVFWYAGGYPDWANVKSIHRGVDEVDHGQYDTEEQVSFATGCCMFFPRMVLKRVGLLDDRYFLYSEDADLSERVKRAGYDIMYIPSAVLWHVNAASSGGAGNVLQDYFITRNQMLFGMTYAPIRTKIALIRQSITLLFTGRAFQKLAIRDFYLGKLGKGTFFDVKKSD